MNKHSFKHLSAHMHDRKYKLRNFKYSSSPLMGEAKVGVKEKGCAPSLCPSHQGRDYSNLSSRRRRPNLRAVLSYIILSLLFISLGSCGYSSKSLLRSNVRSIYVPIFDNNTFRRGYEFDLTKAVRDQILLRTHLSIVDKDEADSILFGKISSVNENVIIEDTKDNLVESQVSIGVDIRWVDKRTGRKIVERKNIKNPTEFIVRRNETLSSASNEAFVRVAQSIVEAMEEDW